MVVMRFYIYQLNTRKIKIYFFLPVVRHLIYLLQTDTEIIIIRILSQHQDAGRHLNWAVVGNHIALREN